MKSRFKVRAGIGDRLRISGGNRDCFRLALHASVACNELRHIRTRQIGHEGWRFTIGIGKSGLAVLGLCDKRPLIGDVP